MWNIFHRKPLLREVTTGRFEIEQNGQVAYLEYSLAGNILELTKFLKSCGTPELASALASTTVRANWPQVDIVCHIADTWINTGSIQTPEMH